MLRVRNRAREHCGDGAVDGREHLAAAQHARGAALRDEDAVRRQLALDAVAVELLGVQLEEGTMSQIRRAGGLAAFTRLLAAAWRCRRLASACAGGCCKDSSVYSWGRSGHHPA